MSFQVAICDDEPVESDYLKKILSAWAKSTQQPITVSVFDRAEALLFAIDGGDAFDILLLDIQMGGMDGVTLAKKIRAKNKNVQIIFITGYMDYITDGYEVEALHYLLKPVSEAKLFSVLDRAAEKLIYNERVLVISEGGETRRVPLREVRFLEVRRNYVTIHAEEPLTVKKTLAAFENELDDGFFRVGRSYIVNLRYVRKATKTELTLSDKSVIPLPRGAYEALNRALIQYF